MPNIPSDIQYINDVEVDQDSVLSEALFTKFGATINGLIDDNTTNTAAIAALETLPGYVTATATSLSTLISGTVTLVSTASLTVDANKKVLVTWELGHGTKGSIINSSGFYLPSNPPDYIHTTATSNGHSYRFLILRGSTTIYTGQSAQASNTGDGTLHKGSFSLVDNPGAGSFQYKIAVQDVGGAGTASIVSGGCSIMAVEI